MKLNNCDRHEDEGRAIRRKAPADVPAVGYNALPGAGVSFSGRYPYCSFCGYRREDHMELVLEEGVIPYDAGDFKRMAGVPKYGDYLRLFLRLRAGDYACYTLREGAPQTRACVEARSTAGGVLQFSCDTRRITCDVVADSEWEMLGALEFDAASPVSMKVECVEGTVEVRSFRFE